MSGAPNAATGQRHCPRLGDVEPSSEVGAGERMTLVAFVSLTRYKLRRRGFFCFIRGLLGDACVRFEWQRLRANAEGEQSD